MANISAALVKKLREHTGLGMMECKKALLAAEGNIEKAVEELRKFGQAEAYKKLGRSVAEGVVATKVSKNCSFGVMIEVNSESDFVTRDNNFLNYIQEIVQTAFNHKETNVITLMTGELEAARLALIQKIGENISVRRIAMVEGGVVNSYIHSNKRISVLVALNAGNSQLARDIAIHVAAVNPQVITKDQMPITLVEKKKKIFKAQAEQLGKPAAIIEKMIIGRMDKFLTQNSLNEQPFVKDPDITVGALAKKSGATITDFVRFEVGEGIEKKTMDFAKEVRAQSGL